MTDSIHAMSRAIGDMEASVRSLNERWGEREASATEGRRVLHQKIDELSKDVVRLSAEVENVSNDLAEIKPAIDAFKAARDRQEGAQKLGKMIWMAFIGLAGVAGAVIVKLLDIRPSGH